MVTHHRLEEAPEGGLVPAGELEEPLVVRPDFGDDYWRDLCEVGAELSRFTDFD